MRTALFVFTILFSFGIDAQTYWHKYYNYSDLNQSRTIEQTPDGGYILCTRNQNQNWLYKMDGTGLIQWAKKNTSSVGVATINTLDGGFLTIYSRYFHTSSPGYLVTKLNSSGSLEWTSNYIIGSSIEPSDVIQLADSSFVICGNAGSSVSEDETGICRIDKDGNFLWGKSFESGIGSKLNGLLELNSGEIIAVGNGNGANSWVVKFDTAGNILGSRDVYGGYLNSPIQTSDGNVVAVSNSTTVGAFLDVTKFDPITLNRVWERRYSMPNTTFVGVGLKEDPDQKITVAFMNSRNVYYMHLAKLSSAGFVTESYYVPHAVYGTTTKGGLAKTTDGYVYTCDGDVKKFPINMGVACGLTATSLTFEYTSGTTFESDVNYTINQNNVLSFGYGFSNSAIGFSSTQYCSTYYCAPINGTDVQTACSSYTWIDGNTYTSSNNTATYTYVAGASNGCDSIVTLDLTIGDLVSPVADVATLSDVTAECTVSSLTAPTATDNCAGSLTGIHDATLPITTQGTTVVTWTYDDGNGNTTTQTQNVVIDDVTAPVVDVATLSEVTAECEVTSLTAPTATDNCAGSLTGTHDATLPITAQGTTLVTWTYDDGNGNTTTQTQNVVINDVTAPVADVATLSDVTAECSVTSLTAPTATDNCSGSLTGTHNASLPITTQGTTVVTWTYDDGNGNTTTQTQNVVIDDVTAPVADVATLSDVTAECTVTSLTAPTATDNCTGSLTGTHNATLPITTQGTTVVTWTYDDGNGNTSTQTQNVIISDNTAPVADNGSLSAVVTSCNQPVTSITAPTATDNCVGTVTGTTSTAFPITSSTTVTWTYDDGNGNTSTQTQNVVINPDVTAPVADQGSLANITAECQVTSLTAPTATDDCAGSITGTHNVTLPITTQGTTVVTWTYDDGNGNTSTQTQNVVIDDVTAPLADAGSLLPVNAECQVASIPAPTATDNCTGTVTGTPNVTFPITSQGTFTITWTYNDGNGNTSTQTQSVTIDDVTAPVPDNAILSDINENCSSTPAAPTATDNCAGTVMATPDISFPITTQGTTTVTWTYDDGNGNTSTQTQDVVIIDLSVPVADVANLSDINSECEVTLTAPTATDNCAGSLTGTPDVTFPITASGTTTITWTYDDGNGNTSTQTQDVIITPIDVNTTTTANTNDYTISADASGYTYQWIENCGTTNDVISGATGQSYTLPSNGTYAVIIDNGTCSDTSDCVVIDDLGVDVNGAHSNVKVYPNPTNGLAHIESSVAIESIELVDALGKTIEVYLVDQQSLEIKTTPGVYFLKIIVEGQESILRIVKE